MLLLLLLLQMEDLTSPQNASCTVADVSMTAACCCGGRAMSNSSLIPKV
jgi:hypothetical protein